MLSTSALPLAAGVARQRVHASRAAPCQPAALGLPALRSGVACFAPSRRPASRVSFGSKVAATASQPTAPGPSNEARQLDAPSTWRNMPLLAVAAVQSAVAVIISALRRLNATAGSLPGLQLAGAAPIAAAGIALSDLTTNVVFMSALYAWATAQVLKVFTKYARTRSWDWRVLVDSGGMPSSHTALVVGLTAAIALQHGLNSTLFPLSLAFSLVVMYDAAGVRRHAGKQAEVLNALVEDYFQGHPVSEQELKEVIGHTPLQVAMGAALGVATAVAYRRFLL